PLRERGDVSRCVPAPIAKLGSIEREAETFCIRMQRHRSSVKRLRGLGRATRTIKPREFSQYIGRIDAGRAGGRRVVELVGAVMPMRAGYRMGQERAVDHLERHPLAVI